MPTIIHTTPVPSSDESATVPSLTAIGVVACLILFTYLYFKCGGTCCCCCRNSTATQPTASRVAPITIVNNNTQQTAAAPPPPMQQPQIIVVSTTSNANPQPLPEAAFIPTAAPA